MTGRGAKWRILSIDTESISKELLDQGFNGVFTSNVVRVDACPRRATRCPLDYRRTISAIQVVPHSLGLLMQLSRGASRGAGRVSLDSASPSFGPGEEEERRLAGSGKLPDAPSERPLIPARRNWHNGISGQSQSERR
jgi:hypothetical protein